MVERPSFPDRIILSRILKGEKYDRTIVTSHSLVEALFCHFAEFRLATSQSDNIAKIGNYQASQMGI